jgi:hypothetical protein
MSVLKLVLGGFLAVLGSVAHKPTSSMDNSTAIAHPLLRRAVAPREMQPDGKPRCGSAHSPILASRASLSSPYQHRIQWRRILPISPAPALTDKFLVEVYPIGQDHIPNGAPVLVEVVRLL